MGYNLPIIRPVSLNIRSLAKTMQKNLLKLIALVVLAFSISACSVFSEPIDDTKSWSASKLYTEAKDELTSGNYDKAVEYFEKLESRYPFGIYAQQAQMEIAYAYYRQNDQAQALAAVERFIKLHPNHPNIDYMYYLRGLVNFNDRVGLVNAFFKQDLSERDPKAAQAAFDSFKLLVSRYPTSVYAEDAHVRLKYLINTLAEYEVHVAKYYYRRGAYLAAANRAQFAVTKYHEAPAIEEALLVLVRSYDKLGLTDLRDDADRVFRKNFPNSKYLKGEQKNDAPWWQLW